MGWRDEVRVYLSDVGGCLRKWAVVFCMVLLHRRVCSRLGMEWREAKYPTRRLNLLTEDGLKLEGLLFHYDTEGRGQR